MQDSKEMQRRFRYLIGRLGIFCYEFRELFWSYFGIQIFDTLGKFPKNEKKSIFFQTESRLLSGFGPDIFKKKSVQV